MIIDIFYFYGNLSCFALPSETLHLSLSSVMDCLHFKRGHPFTCPHFHIDVVFYIGKSLLQFVTTLSMQVTTDFRFTDIVFHSILFYID